MLIIANKMPKRTKIFVQNEGIVCNDGKMTQKYRCSRDERPIYRWRGDHGKFITYGMLSISGERFFRSYDAFDGPTFLRCVKDAVAKYGRILIIADRIRPHRMINLEEYLQENKDWVRIKYLSRASSQHDIIEII